jgi:hypothetical protein
MEHLFPGYFSFLNESQTLHVNALVSLSEFAIGLGSLGDFAQV